MPTPKPTPLGCWPRRRP